MLCLSCGRYGHYKEGCPYNEKGKEIGIEGGTHDVNTMFREESERKVEQLCIKGGEGPWRVVHKVRRGKKTLEGRRIMAPTRVNEKV